MTICTKIWIIFIEGMRTYGRRAVQYISLCLKCWHYQKPLRSIDLDRRSQYVPHQRYNSHHLERRIQIVSWILCEITLLSKWFQTLYISKKFHQVGLALCVLRSPHCNHCGRFCLRKYLFLLTTHVTHFHMFVSIFYVSTHL